MINISDFKQLGIILPNTNKALERVLRDATHKELEAITQGKDLKTVLGNILKQSAATPDANKELLQVVKDNPTLKNLGDVSTSIKDLLTSLKSDKNPLPLEKVLENFLSNMKDVKNTPLKQKLDNSGIFLESKLKDVQNPQLELKNTLISLVKNLQNTTSPTSKVIANEAKVLLHSEVLKSLKTPSLESKVSNFESINTANDNPKALTQLSSAVDKLITSLKTTLSKADSIHTPVLTKALEQLHHKLEPKILTSENFKLAPIKESLEVISTQLQKSFTMESKSLMASLDKILEVLKSVAPSPTTSKVSLESFLEKNVPKMITNLTEEIKTLIQKADPIFHKDTTSILNKLESLNTPQKLHPQNNVKEIMTNDLKAVLLQAGEEVTKSNHPNQTEILKHIDKLSLQIDNYQLLSHLSNGTSLYLPYSWDMMEEGNIQMKKSDDDKFYCDIYLKLKEYGEINLKLTLYEKNQLNLHIYSSNEAFKNIIQENIPLLRSALIDTQITPREIRIHEPKTNAGFASAYKQVASSAYETEIRMGFEVKG
jgi:hypothetical protein